ncbi:type IV toxin-antitoxin system AbiEi family antitoxin domain-containing protein [Rothia sp. ARF10]|nr:type IV toxin-antitoxin system AbiEi family antitoxin domain-containing protein [Rothia sp. ARF10]
MDHHASAFASLPQPFSRAEILLTGVSEWTLRRAAASGFLITLAKGLYAVREPWLAQSQWARHRHKAVAAARLTPDAIVSHASGAALLGLPHPAYAPEKVAMTVLDDVRTSRQDTWRRFHRGRTPPEHVVIRHGVPGFVASRVVIDSGREVHGRDALAIADGAIRAGLVCRDELLDMRSHQRHWPGVAATNDVLLLADGRRENWLESASAWSMRRWGLPVGAPQVNVFTTDGEFVGRPDVLWQAQGLVGEADGIDKYLLNGATDREVRAQLQREAVRETGFTDLGLQVIRWTPRESILGEAIHTRFTRNADSTRSAKVRAVFRCSCCNHPLEECLVEAELLEWRGRVARMLERRIW